MTIDACKVLMIFPRFNTDSFWNYRAACELTGARYPAAPLGLITVAALLPQSWEVRLINRNTESLTDADLESMGGPVAVEVAGRRVFICCKGCEKALKADPQKYLAKLKR